MASPTAVSSSTPAMEQWRPQGDHLTYGDAAWSGAALGVAMHAALNFFSVAIPSLERFLIVFAPAQNFAFALTRNAPAVGRWLMLLASQAAFWALAGIALLAAVREIVSLARRASYVKMKR